MKKTTALAMALVLTMMFGGAALAETPSVEEKTEVVTELPAEPVTEAMPTEHDSFFSWIGQGVDLMSDAVHEGWERATDAVETGWDKTTDFFEDGWDLMLSKIHTWSDRAEAYMRDKKWDAKVQEAWNMLKQGAERQGEIAQEKLDDAYQTVVEWLVQTNDTVNQHVAEAVDGVAEAAGVAKARMSSWYRKMESYMMEKADLTTDTVRDAWATIKQGAAEANSVTEEKLHDAYAAIRDWLDSIGESEDSEIMQTLEKMEEAES